MKLNTVIIDDDRIFHFLLDIMLKEVKLSDSSINLHNGNDFISWWQHHNQNQENYLLFLDLNMPFLNGWEILDILQMAGSKNIFVVIITSSIDPKDKQRADKYPMVIDYFVKPIHLQRLIDLKKNISLQPFLE